MNPTNTMTDPAANTSGQGDGAAVPAEIDRWNWGAFLLNWIWGIGNGTFIALLCFVPLVGLVMMFVLGAKGSAWAWRNKRWDGVEHFRRVQRRWAIAGALLWLSIIPLFVGLFLFISALMKDTPAYRMTMSTLAASEAVVAVVGQPMKGGMAQGSISTSGPDGRASLSIPVEGPKGRGTAHVQAVEELGQWRIEALVFEEEGTGRRLEVKP